MISENTNTLTFPPPVQIIKHPVAEKHGVELKVLRLDLIHPVTGGNKYYKLKYNIEQARKEGHDTLLSFGGAYSNHILALGVTGSQSGFKTIGIIRGEERLPLNKSLQTVTAHGMKLRYVPRQQYRDKHNPGLQKWLREEFGRFYLVPEGGSNELAVKGCEEILHAVTKPFDIVCCTCGTGATVAGIIRSLKPGQKAIGFPVLKGGEFLREEIRRFIAGKYPDEDRADWTIQTQYHFGGYAKQTPRLLQFIRNFQSVTSIPLDRIYTGKMFYGVMDMIQQNYFPSSAKILLVHTGGLPNGTPDFTSLDSVFQTADSRL